MYVEDMNLVNTSGNQINPAQDETVMYLKQIVKLLTPLATQDINQRLRVNIDAGTLPTVSSVTNFGGSAVLPTVTTVSNVTALGNVDGRYVQMDTARLLYTQMIRSKLSFT